MQTDLILFPQSASSIQVNLIYNFTEFDDTFALDLKDGKIHSYDVTIHSNYNAPKLTITENKTTSWGAGNGGTIVSEDE